MSRPRPGLPEGMYDRLLRPFLVKGVFVNPLDAYCARNKIQNSNLVRDLGGEIDQALIGKYRRFTPERYLARENVTLPTPVNAALLADAIPEVELGAWTALWLIRSHLSLARRRQHSQKMVARRAEKRARA